MLDQACCVQNLTEDERRELIVAARERLERERRWKLAPWWKALQAALLKLEGKPRPEKSRFRL